MPFYLGIQLLSGPKFWPTDPKFCVEFEYEFDSGFQSRNGELCGETAFQRCGFDPRQARKLSFEYENHVRLGFECAELEFFVRKFVALRFGVLEPSVSLGS